MQKTHNNANTHEHSLSHALEFFSKAGSLFVKRESSYQGDESALSLFQKTWIVDKTVSLKLLFWLRDCRGGAGNRSGFKACLVWLAEHDPEWVKTNIHLIPEHGRWNDLECLYDTSCEKEALQLWAAAIRESDNLACKWADRKDKKLRKYLELTPKEYRKKLVEGTQVVETPMCAKEWRTIEYSKVPSVAMARYTKAFNRHDAGRFSEFKSQVEEGTETINTGVLFPHDCMRTARHGDTQIANLQFENLPNFLEGTNKRIVCICDTSGSMDVHVSGEIKAVDISVSLSLYCSNMLGKENPFYRKFLQFESETKLTDWRNYSFSDMATGKSRLFTGAVGSTNIEKALNTLLEFATFYNVTKEQVPNVLMIVSDMQFDQMVGGAEKTVVENCLDRWEKAGFDKPTIIYWNTAGYAGSPATLKTPNTALVSGFSPAILKGIFSGEDISPGAVMNRALEKYEIVEGAGV